MSEYLYPTDTELFLEDVVNLYTHLCAPFFFNMKETQEEKDAVMAELDKIIEICNKLKKMRSLH